MDSRPTLPQAVGAALQRFRTLLERRFGDRLLELVLFGSRARSQAGEDSDTDVLVVVRGLTEAERAEVFGLAYDADAAALHPDDWAGLSVLAYSDEQVADLRSRERLLLRNIDREGLRV
jgi:predicted nucleotidyltransferase